MTSETRCIKSTELWLDVMVDLACNAQNCIYQITISYPTTIIYETPCCKELFCTSLTRWKFIYTCLPYPSKGY